MSVTVKKIAEIAGVSRGTVDRALNNRTGVKKEVADHIMKVAEELGYKPNPAAKALADKRYGKKKIGILLISEGKEFFDEVIAGCKDSLEELDEFGIESTMKTMNGYSTDRQLQLLDELEQEAVSGIVITPVNTPEIVNKINDLAARGIQVVTINTDVLNSKRMAYVGCQYKKSGAIAAGLIGMISVAKNETIGIIMGSKHNLAVARRLEGLVETIKNDFPDIKIANVYENEDDDGHSYQVTKQLLEESDNITTLCFCGAGIEGGLQAVMELKLEHYLKIITFDLIDANRKAMQENIVEATICQDPYKQGYEGVQIMGKYLLFGQYPVEEKQYTELSIHTKYSL